MEESLIVDKWWQDLVSLYIVHSILHVVHTSICVNSLRLFIHYLPSWTWLLMADCRLGFSILFLKPMLELKLFKNMCLILLFSYNATLLTMKYLFLKIQCVSYLYRQSRASTFLEKHLGFKNSKTDILHI